MYQSVVNSYQRTQFFTTHPLKLVLMCYEGAIGSLKLARDSYVAGRFEVKADSLQKCYNIIHELNASLDLEKGGECAANLRSLYAYVTQALTEADLKRDIEAMDRVIAMLEELESAWKAVADPAGAGGENRSHPEICRGAEPVAVARAWSV
jgi:flagellar secretion chaperone FliS